MDNKITYVNSACKIFIKDKDELCGKDIREVIPHTRLHVVCKMALPNIILATYKAGYLCGNQSQYIITDKLLVLLQS